MDSSFKWLVGIGVVLISFSGLMVLSITLNEQSLYNGDNAETPGVLVLNDELEFAAIKAIHGQLDDNADGSVDLSESSEFVQTELCGPNLEGQQSCWSSDKSTRFHQTDKQITSLELWTTWHKNCVINWTNSDVISWLENSVGLSQYSETFRFHKITGRHIPQLAINTDQILQNVLLITNSKHKQKIQLRAMDIVLFGPPVTLGYWKDAMLILSIALSVFGVLYALRQRQVAQSKIDSFLEDFRVKEKELSMLKSKLEFEEDLNGGEEQDGDSPTSVDTPPLEDDDTLSSVSFKRFSSLPDRPDSILSQLQDDNESLRNRVLVLENQVDTTSNNMSQLHELLQECYRKEWSHLDCRRKAAEEQMSRAQKVCNKIKKRRSSLFGTFHLANSSALEEAGLHITKAVNKMHSISECFDEYHRRWKQIESVSGHRISSSPASPLHTYMYTPHTVTPSQLHKEISLNFQRQDSINSLASLSSTSTSTSSHQSSIQKGATFPRNRKSSFISDSLNKRPVSSSPENSLELYESKPYHPKLGRPQSQLFTSQTDGSSVIEGQDRLTNKRGSDPTPVHNSTSMPVFVRKTSYTEAVANSDTTSVDTETYGGISFVASDCIDGAQSVHKTGSKALQPIKEEKRKTSTVDQRRRSHLNGHRTLTHSSFSSDV